MFNYSTLKTGFAGLIGFKNSRDPNIPKLDSGLTSTLSGLYMSDFHPLLNTDNLEGISFNYTGYDAHSLTATYNTGDYAISSDISWVSKTDANVGNAVAVGTYWKTGLSEWFLDSYNASLNKLIARLSVHKKLAGASKTYLDNVQLFDGTSHNSDTITTSGRFVGFELELKKYNNVKAVVDRVGLRFTQAQTDLTLYLFHSSRNTAIATATVSTNTGYNFEWKTPSWELPYVDYSGNTDAGGKWYVGYFEDDISGNAINRSYDFSSAPCNGCGGSDESYYNLWSKYVTIKPIQVSTLNGTDLFDISKVGYNWTQTWGLNLALSVKTDFTEMAVNNKMLWVDPLGKQFAVDMLETMAYSGNTRINTKAANGELMALQALTGAEGVKGMSELLEESLRGLAEDFANISPVLSTERKGITYGAI